MTAISGAVPRSTGSLDRTIKVMRLHLVNRLTYLGIPWIITGVAVAVSIVATLLIHAAVPEASRAAGLDGMRYSWAVLSPLWYLAVVGVQAVVTMFPLALGFSSTRREFALGTLLTFVVMSAINATGWASLTMIERALNRSGVDFHHFTALWFDEGGVGTVWLSMFSLQILFFAVTSACAAVYARWRTMGMVVLWITVVVMLLGFVALVVLTGASAALVEWLLGLTLPTVFAALLVPAALAFALGWAAMRRAPVRG